MHITTNILTPWWVTGITDSEGSFTINYNKVTNKVTFSFKVTQKEHSISILTDLQGFFNVGNINIDNKQANAYKYIVNKTEDLLCTIIPHFDKYPLMGSKQLDFLDWKEAIINYAKNKDIKPVLKIKESMNSKRSFEQRWLYLENKTIKLFPEWIQAFIDGEGCFQCTIGNHKNRDKYILSITITLEVAQHTHDVRLLEAIKSYFNQGYLKPKFNIGNLKEALKVRSVSRYVTHSSDKLIKFFDKYPMFTLKQKDFLDWKKLIELKNANAHKEKDGLEYMLAIKKGMNRGRLYDTNVISSSDKLNLIRLSSIPSNRREYHSMVRPHYSEVKRMYSTYNRDRDNNPYLLQVERYVWALRKERIKENIKKFFLCILELVITFLSIILYIILTLMQAPDAFENIFQSPIQDIDISMINIEFLPTELDLDLPYFELESIPVTWDKWVESYNPFSESVESECYDPFAELDVNNYLYINIPDFVLRNISLITSSDNAEIQARGIADLEMAQRIADNESAFEINSLLKFEVLELMDKKFIVCDNSIFNGKNMQILIDNCLVKMENASYQGNKVISLVIDTELANTFGLYDSDSNFYSNLIHSSELSSDDYESRVRDIRTDSVHFTSPELREILTNIHNKGDLIVINVDLPNDETGESLNYTGLYPPKELTKSYTQYNFEIIDDSNVFDQESVYLEFLFNEESNNYDVSNTAWYSSFTKEELTISEDTYDNLKEKIDVNAPEHVMYKPDVVYTTHPE